MVLLRELGSRALIALGASLLLLVIAVIFEVAIDMGESAWQLALGLAFALGLSALALAGIHRTMSAALGRTAMGWWGLMSGRVPPGFGPGDGNLARGLGDLLACALAMPAGLTLARAGARAGQHAWSASGTFLCGAGVVFGLLAAVPRLYFARPRGPVRDPGRTPVRGARRAGAAGPSGAQGRDTPAGSPAADRADDVALLVTAAMLGIALSMCTASTIANRQRGDARRALARGDWAAGCIAAPPEARCPAQVTLELAPRRLSPLRIETVTTCALVIEAADGRQVRARDPAELRRAAASPATTIETRELHLEADPGARYELRLSRPASAERCTFLVRYLEDSR